MSIRSKLILSLACVACATAVAGYLSRKSNREVHEILGLLAESSEKELLAATQLVELAQDTQISMDVYIGSRRRDVTRPAEMVDRRRVWEANRAEIEAGLAQTHDLLKAARAATEEGISRAASLKDAELLGAEKEEITEMIEPISRSLARHESLMRECLELFPKNNGGISKAERFFQTEIIPHFEDHTLPLLRAYRDDSLSEVTEQTETAHAVLAAADRRTLAITIGAGLLAICLGLALARAIATPLERLKAVVKRFGRGDHSARAKLKHDDEIGTLGAAFNQMADNLQESEAKLEAEAAQRLRAEEQAHQRLQKLAHLNRLNAMGEMAAGLAHELNQPLGAATTYSQASIRLLEGGDADPAELTGIMRKAAEQTQRAGEIVRSLREFVINHTPSMAPCSASDLIVQVAKLLNNEARAAETEIAFDFADGLPEVLVDRVQVQQVLLNLIRNGIEATAENKPGKRRVVVSTATSPGGAVLIGVADNGESDPSDDLERLFDPFVSSKSEGMGLGLAISRSIVESHRDSRLWATANEGGGLTFYFTLPGAMAESENLEPAFGT